MYPSLKRKTVVTRDIFCFSVSRHKFFCPHKILTRWSTLWQQFLEAVSASLLQPGMVTSSGAGEPYPTTSTPETYKKIYEQLHIKHIIGYLTFALSNALSIGINCESNLVPNVSEEFSWYIWTHDLFCVHFQTLTSSRTLFWRPPLF